MTATGAATGLAKRVLAGEVSAIARMISWAERGALDGAAEFAEIYRGGGSARVVGITGPPGAGKSTLVAATGAELRRRGLAAGTVALKLRYHDFTTITRSHTEDATRDEENIVRRAMALLDRTDAGRVPVRLLGVSVHNLVENLVARPEDLQPSLPFEAPTL
jgi:hypothetical protein